MENRRTDWWVAVVICVMLCFTPPALSEDCNHNGVPDDQDIFSGTSEDCNTNIIPDECEAYIEHKLTASDAAAGDVFGCSVAIDGDMAIVGAFADDDRFKNSGSAYIYRFNGNTWVEEAKLTAIDATQNDRFGWSVGISGDVAVIGANKDNSAYVYRFNSGSWVKEAKLVASDGVRGDLFGTSVAICSNVVVIGAPHHDGDASNAGSAYVFRFNGNNWAEETKLTASSIAADNYFGQSVSISDHSIVIGAPTRDSSSSSGSAYVFRFNGTTWVEEAQLTSSDAAEGDLFGCAVSISGNVAVIGASSDDEGDYHDAGSAYVFRYNGSGWIEEAKLNALDYGKFDYFGHSVSISGNQIIIGAYANDNVGVNAGAAYLYHFDSIAWIQDAKLTVSGPIASDDSADISGDHFGESVSISGDLALVGVRNDDDAGDNAGSAYVYHLPAPTTNQDCNTNGVPDACDINKGISQDCNQNGLPDECDIFAGTSADCNNNGIPDACDIENGTSDDCNNNGIPDDCELYIEQKLNPLDTNYDHYGKAVAVSGNVAVIGAVEDMNHPTNPGSAYIFRLSGGIWIEEANLRASDTEIDDRFADAVAIDGDVTVIGAELDDDGGRNSGSAYVFRYNGGTWVEEAKLTASDAASDDRFGHSVAICGDVLVIGADGDKDDSGNDWMGSVYVFRFNGTTWVEEAKISASDGVAHDYFGRTVSMSGDVIAIGAMGDDDDGSYSGSAYVYRFNGTSWMEEAKLTASDANVMDEFGYSVSVSGDIMVIGAVLDDDGGQNSGSTYIFRFNGSSWDEEAKLTASDAAIWDNFGTKVSISDDMVVIGASGNQDDGYVSGSAYIYRWDGNSWIEDVKLTAPDAGEYDVFGGAVGIHDKWAIIGAPRISTGGELRVGSVFMYRHQDHEDDGLIDDCDNCPHVYNPDQVDADADNIGDVCDLCPHDPDNDADGDGVCGDIDACADSDIRETIVINGCDSGVANQALGDGCTMADEIAQVAETATNHGAFVNQVAHLTNDWKRNGLISGADKGHIQRCAAR